MVEDDPQHLQALREESAALPHQVLFVTTRADAEEALSREQFCAVVCDVSIPADRHGFGCSDPAQGLALIRWIRDRTPAGQLPIIANSSSSLGNALAVREGADDDSPKTLDGRQLEHWLARTCEALHPGACPHLAPQAGGSCS